MSAFRDFDVARAEANREPIRFRLAGRDFTTHPYLPAGPVLDLAMHAEDGGVKAFAAFAEFLDAFVVETDDLRAALREIELPVVIEVARWLVAEANARPFESVSSSESPPPSTGAELNVSWTPTVVEGRSA